MSRRAAVRPPLDRETVMDDLREVLLGVAYQIALTSGDYGPAADYLGLDLDGLSFGGMPSGHREILRGLDLDRFYITRQIGSALDFALQIGTLSARSSFGEEDWNDISVFVEGGPRCSYGGEPTPLADEDSSLRRTLDMALARMTLRHGGVLTIRQLALLADIGETAVRTSLSSDGIRTEGKPAHVAAEVAEPWLRRRRGYVPTIEPEESATSEAAYIEARLRDLPFAQVLMEVMELRGVDVPTLARETEVEVDWLRSLVDGNAVDCDLGGLCRLAHRLQVEVPIFAGRAVTDILTRDSATPSSIEGHMPD